MLIKYYKSSDLAYANRKRYRTFNYVADSQEEQNAVKLGDGSTTTVTTSVSNLCNYVKIGDTRWYVVSYRYKNGGQVVLNLRRDVVGEFGLNNCSGKIERGYTNTFLRNRKELDLNQRLIKRLPIIPETKTYGNYEVNTHDNEKWGIIYMSKPTDLEPGQTTVSVPIPGFSPYDYNPELSFIANGTTKYLNNDFRCSNEFYVDVVDKNISYRINIFYQYNQENNSYSYTIDIQRQTGSDNRKLSAFLVQFTDGGTSFSNLNSSGIDDCARQFAKVIAEKIIYNKINNINISAYNLPETKIKDTSEEEIEAFSSSSILYNGKYYRYNITETDVLKQGTKSVDGFDLYTDVIKPEMWDTPIIRDIVVNGVVRRGYFSAIGSSSDPLDFGNYFFSSSNNTITEELFNNTQLTPSEAGTLILDITQDYVDEPYLIYAMPLYDVTITGQGISQTVSQTDAFMTFNTTIEYLSGENAYLVDAQIYPYCPNLRDADTSLNGIPVFTVMTTSFERTCYMELDAYADVKKEYIKREYSIKSPDQSAQFDFNFYDYVNTIVEETKDGKIINSTKLGITIKTSLKPFNIISSAVISPEQSSLIGLTYPSDLRGCKTVGSGFECSISTDQFQQYVRNNVNYQKLFKLDQEELLRQHNVEKVNETTSTVVNTLSATMMGFIGGGALGDTGLANIFGSKVAGASVMGATAGATVGTAMGIQLSENEKLRAYERDLQQQRFDLTIGTVKNLPNQVSRISSFNEIIMRDYYYVVEVYECSEPESILVDDFIEKYSYGLGIIGLYNNFIRDKWFIRGTLITSNLYPILHNLLNEELKGGIYYNE